ncbi:MAG: S9 family peptidase [Longimicrobiales bacterium]
MRPFFDSPALSGALVLALAFSAPASGQARTGRALPVDQLLDITSVLGGDTPQWAPDGSRILFRSSLGGVGLMTIAPEGGFPRRVPVTLGGAGHFLASNAPRYSLDGRWISFVSDRSGTPELWLWSTQDGREVQVTDLRSSGINSYSWSPDGRQLAFAANLNGNYDIWTVAIPGGAPRRITSDLRLEVYPWWTPDSQRLLHVRLDDRWVDHEIIETAADGNAPRVVASDEDFFDYTAGGTFGYPMVSPDGRFVLFRSHRSGWINYWVVPLAGGEPRPLAADEADQSDAAWSPDGRHVAFTANRNGTHCLLVADAEGGRSRVLVAPDGMGVVQSLAWAPGGDRISYTLATPVAPADLYVVDMGSGATRPLTFSGLEGGIEETLVVPEKVSYANRDGTPIAAYLYRPHGLTAGQRVPAIVFAHGGPASQYNDTFQPEVQFFVQRGYAALLPNFRGSTGYGRDFQLGARQCWGHCDLDDVLAGVDYLKTLSWVDPARMGITGNSYGGYMSCAAITVAPTVFQAAIPRSGYCNRVSFRQDGELRHIKQVEYYFGDFERNEAVYYRSSPYFHIANIQTPTFLIHGEGRFPESPQFRNFADEMQRQYKTFRYKAFQGEDYYVNGRANRRQMYLDMLEFFDHYLKRLEYPGSPPIKGDGVKQDR